MPRLPRLFVLVVLVLSLSVVAFGCKNGGGKKSSTPTSTAAASPTAGDLTPVETPVGAQALPFDSFHYVIDVNFTITQGGETDQSLIGLNVEGDYVGPNSHSYSNSFEFSELSGTQDVIIIGPDAWLREGSGNWTATTADAPEILDTVSLSSADPEFPAAGTDLAGSISALNSDQETRNGVQTHRYTISNADVQALKDILGQDFLANTSGLQDFGMTVWLDDDTNGLVSADLNGTADPSIFGTDSGFNLSPDATVSFTMTIELTQVNDDSISIEPPI
jgi:hypothetical protein